MKKEIQIGIGDSTKTAKGFIDAWKRAEHTEKVEVPWDIVEARLKLAA